MNTPKIKMKICLIGPFYPLRGGIALFNKCLSDSLEKKGHSVACVNFRDKLYPSLLFPGKTQFELPGDLQNLHQAHALIGPLDFISWIRTAQIINNEPHDINIFSYWHPYILPCYYNIVSRLKGSKNILLLHNVISHDSKKWEGFFVKKLIKKFDGCVVMSSSSVDEISKLNL